MEATEVLAVINDYKESGRNWYRLAGLVGEISTRETWRSHFKSNNDWLDEASKISGYHATVMRRMIRARDFLDRLVDQGYIFLKDENDIPLAVLELLERMYPLNPERTKELVDSALNKGVTFRQVKAEYDDIVSMQSNNTGGSSTFARLSHAFQLRAGKTIKKTVSVLSGDGNIKVIKRAQTSFSFPLRNDILIAVIKTQSDEMDFDGYIPYFILTHESIKSHISLLVSISYHCEFFRRLWIVLPDGPGIDFIEELSGKLRMMELYNVAFAILNDNPKSEDAGENLYMTRSVYQPGIDSPSEIGFFPLENEYTPRWKHILLDQMQLKRI